MDHATTRIRPRTQSQEAAAVTAMVKTCKAEHWKIRGISPPPPPSSSAHCSRYRHSGASTCKVKTSKALRISRALLVCVAMLLIISSFTDKFDEDEDDVDSVLVFFLPIVSHRQNKRQQRQSMLSMPRSPSSAIHSDKKQWVSQATISSTVQAPSSDQKHRWKPLNGNDDVGNAIFYNIYTPPEDPTAAMSIVNEQLNQIKMSSQSSNLTTTRTLYYNLIGPSSVAEIVHGGHNVSFDSSLLGSSSNNIIHHQLLQHVEKGGEDLTLDALWEYCLERPSATVAYIHDKGSLHANWHGVRRRRFHATAAALSDECFGMGTSSIGGNESDGNNNNNNNKCNTCAASIHFTPHHYVPANMWTAKCSYIRQLVRPSTLSSKLLSMYRKIQENVNASDYYRCLVSPLVLAALDDCKAQPGKKPISSSLGVFREANAHWLVLHPDWQPCSVYPVSYLKYPQHRQPPIALQPEPVEHMPMLSDEVEKYNKPRTHHHPMFQTEGYLYKYQYLYNKTPAETSWFWWYYQHLNGHDRCKK
jgi:hypothetical protein